MSDSIDPATAGAPEAKPGTSALGLASVGLALVSGLGICLVSGLEVYLVANHRSAKPRILVGEMVIGGLGTAGVMLGALLGVIALFQKRSKVVPAIGLVLNLGLLALAATMLVVSLAFGRH